MVLPAGGDGASMSPSEATSVDQGPNRNEAGAAYGSGQPAVDQRAEGGSTAEEFPSLSSIEELPSLTSSDQSYLRRFFGEDQAGINNPNLDQASPSSATNQPTGVMAQAGPSTTAPPVLSSPDLGPAEPQVSLIWSQVKQELLHFLRFKTKIEPKFTFVAQVKEDLQIDDSDLPRLEKKKGRS